MLQTLIKRPIARIVTLLILSQLIAGLILIPFFSLNIINPDDFNNGVISIELMSLILLLQTVANIFLIYQMQKNYDKQLFVKLGFSRENLFKKFSFGLGFGILSIVMAYLILLLFGLIETSINTISLYHFSLYFGLFTIVAINEEILIRGYILKNLLNSLQKYASIIISALIFTLLHSGNSDVSLISFINLFLVGIFLGIYYVSFKDLWFPIGFHFTWNFIQGPVLGFSVSGLPVESLFIQKLTGDSTLTGGNFGLEGSLLIMLLLIFLCMIVWYKSYQIDKKHSKHLPKIHHNSLIKN